MKKKSPFREKSVYYRKKCRFEGNSLYDEEEWI